MHERYVSSRKYLFSQVALITSEYWLTLKGIPERGGGVQSRNISENKRKEN